MSNFKKVNTKTFSKPSQKVTPDSIYWKKLGVPVLVKDFGPVDYIDFSPVEPHFFAVTCSMRVQIYNPVTKGVIKNLNKFQKAPFGATFRSDGRLICAGSEDGLVSMLDVSSKSLLRVFRGHKAAVHRTYFTSDNTHIASFSDDKTVCRWDIPTEAQLNCFTEHNDFIRAGAASPVSPEILISGGYDGAVCMYDCRNNQTVFKVEHGAPVESILVMPSGGIFLSAGGTEIRVWDAFYGGKLLTKISQHHKTITSLRLASNGNRLMSASLDQHVKIYDVSSYRSVHTLDYSNGILSLGISADDDTVVAGMVDGLISIRRFEEEVTPEKPKKRKVSHRYFSDKVHSTVDEVVEDASQKATMAKYDVALRKFQYCKALKIVLDSFWHYKSPQKVTAVLKELMRRKGFKLALTGCEEKLLNQMLKFLIKYISDYRFAFTLIKVADIVIDVVENNWDSCSEETVALFDTLRKELVREETMTQELLALQGALQMILTSNDYDDEQSEVVMQSYKPSNGASQNFVVNVS
ncbi:unnamed protein product [Bemisia tabaci]|uniref:U3 small nucleolar RNA-associated protein 15 homolog n=1 Tax=Bemisia tabaci TaxID=7038 RepID=A0A9P0G189_BEMTA|nr:PREDICTED: U3 small nucleolar RNA-associated protein 15 homolog [Bemisia tabaci]CAH0765040.1 unnamed protein product [Bemisia tabaci]